MWFGLQFPDFDLDAGDGLVVLAYEPDHVFRVRTEPDALPVILSLLRDAAAEADSAAPPRCTACGEGFELPPDAVLEGPCGSA